MRAFEMAICDDEEYWIESKRVFLCSSGLYCETKIVVEQKSVLRFLLEKINLSDWLKMAAHGNFMRSHLDFQQFYV